MVRVHGVLPAAGLGTRLRPLTEHVPKEMLPLGRYPVIGHVLHELRAADIRTVHIVVSPSKGMVQAYCGDGSSFGVTCRYAVQERMRGVGDAVLCAVAAGAKPPLLVAFADCAIMPAAGLSGPGSTKRLVRAFEGGNLDAAVLCEQVPRERTRNYGVLAPESEGESDTQGLFRVRDIVEKPDPSAAPSTWVVAARWILGERAVDFLKVQEPGPSGEVGITEAVAALLRAGGFVVAVPLGAGERRLDVGTIRSYLCAQAFASLHDPEHGHDVRDWLGHDG